MKKLFLIAVLLGCTLVYLQQQSFAEKADHKAYSTMAIKDCNACHKSEGVEINHDADFDRSHRVLAGRAGNNCSQCHEQSMCLNCHQGGGTGDDLTVGNFRRDYKPKDHRSDFMSIHPMKALDRPQHCYSCHDKSYCSSCHDRFPKGSLRIRSHNPLGSQGQQYWALDHSTEARRNLQSCQSCHPEGDVCIQCHRSGKTRPHPRDWKASSFKDKINGKMCLKCHLPGTF